MADDVDTFFLGIKGDITTDIRLAAVESLQRAVQSVFDDSGVETDTENILTQHTLIEYLANLSQESIAAGLKACTLEIADEIKKGVDLLL